MNKKTRVDLADIVTGLCIDVQDKLALIYDDLPDYECFVNSEECPKISIADLRWIEKRLNMIKKVADSILTDERWKRFEVGRVYLTRWDCLIRPEGVRQAA